MWLQDARRQVPASNAIPAVAVVESSVSLAPRASGVDSVAATRRVLKCALRLAVAEAIALVTGHQGLGPELVAAEQVFKVGATRPAL